jgi:hypothetical protein
LRGTGLSYQLSAVSNPLLIGFSFCILHWFYLFCALQESNKRYNEILMLGDRPGFGAIRAICTGTRDWKVDYMKSCKMAFLCIVLSAACIAQAKDTLFPPIAPDPLIISNPFTPDLMPIPEPIEAGRKLCVRPDVPGTEDYDWLYFPPFQKPPATPDPCRCLPFVRS